MGITALVMAGGRGTRIRIRGEKPLLKIGGKPLIEHVIDALKRADEVDRIVVAVSKHAPQTAKKARELSVEAIATSGEGYILDVREAVKRLKLSYVLTVSADLPLITGEVIDKVIKHYMSCGKSVLAVMVPAERFENLGLSMDLILDEDGRRLVPAGVNVLDGNKVYREEFEKELDQELLIIDSEEFVNVNTPQDLRITEQLFSSRLSRNRPFEALQD
ncbi:MAG: NTP transferase domain-containing protein [archaeon]|nr:NTP transferase domain-containing protein [archaeon]MCP8307016.1 NTP transferase domain-containing protein [archaeon]